MQRQLSNVSVYSYQDYQPSRKYGQQYEPGGYASAVQQRTNMTQREDALKFEQGRIKALQEERLHIQKKTFTKWINSFLQKARMEVEDLFVDLADGRRLLKLLEIISGERLPRANNGRMRVHKIENVNKSLSFLHTKVRLESIGAEDIVDGNPRLILGLIWTIILRFQIQEIEIDVDEENESSEKKSAKDALLLWCQRKTSGYHGVHIHNFTDSWRSGLGFNALIHAHRPDLFRWSEVPVTEHVETLNHAFDVAEKHLGIPRLLDAEDVDTNRPDEKSVMTYVASYYHTFARMKNEQKSGRRIANIIGQMMDCDDRKGEYSKLFSVLLEWILLKIQELNGREFPNSLDGIQRLLLSFKQYRTVEKPPKYKERSEIEALYFHINTMQKSLTGEAWVPLEGQLPQDLERAWQQLEQAEHAREIALRTELLRQQRLEQLNYKFNTKSVLRKGYLKEMIQVLSDPRYGSNLAQVDATVKKHEAISADILARTERFEDLSAMAAELVREKYHGAEAVSRTEQAVLTRWNELLELLERHISSLGKLAHLMALLREADTVGHTLSEMKAQFQSEEVGRHLVDVERLLQAHALQELQLGALDESIRRLVRHGASAEGGEGPKQQLTAQLNQLSHDYDSLVAAAKDRKARLEDARNLYQFLEDHDEEEGWVTEKQRICRTDVAAKELRAVLALKQKHTALLHELRARDHVSQRHRAKGQRDLANLERKLQKHEAFERELQANEKQLRNVESIGQSLQKSDPSRAAEVSEHLSGLQTAWEELVAASRDKGSKLRQAAQQRKHRRSVEDAKARLIDLERQLKSEEIGTDLRSCKRLLNQHQEIDRINQMEDDEDFTPFEEEFSRWISREPYFPRPYGQVRARDQEYVSDTVTPIPIEVRPLLPPREIIPTKTIPPSPGMSMWYRKTSTPSSSTSSVATNDEEKKKAFALTPLDKEYYEPADQIVTQKSDGPHEGGDSKTDEEALNLMAFQPPRKIRQNPNLGRTKNLVAENLDRLRTGFTQENPAGTDKPHHIHVLESPGDLADSFNVLILIIAVGAALTLATVGFAIGWYTLSKKAKAAADVDYPAYGVTGPNIDTSGDRKLAHSAHMYHYQHQKQQIIAMERNGCEHRNGSVSDPESEEENEEGDYTVYECPGFATTGDMEVKNPLFSEDPTPATPGKCEIVKPQPKD